MKHKVQVTSNKIVEFRQQYFEIIKTILSELSNRFEKNNDFNIDRKILVLSFEFW